MTYEVLQGVVQKQFPGWQIARSNQTSGPLIMTKENGDILALLAHGMRTRIVLFTPSGEIRVSREKR